MLQIILTGYPALQNAVSSINKGVDHYLIKPVNTDELLRLIKEHLDKQRREIEYSQQKLAKFVETRFNELQTEELDVATTKRKSGD
jgi:ActR/RegA family two-component response regulator